MQGKKIEILIIIESNPLSERSLGGISSWCSRMQNISWKNVCKTSQTSKTRLHTSTTASRADRSPGSSLSRSRSPPDSHSPAPVGSLQPLNENPFESGNLTVSCGQSGLATFTRADQIRTSSLMVLTDLNLILNLDDFPIDSFA